MSWRVVEMAGVPSKQKRTVNRHHDTLMVFKSVPFCFLSPLFSNQPITSGKGNLQMIKNSAFSTNFFANFHYFCILFPSSRQNSTKPQHFTMHHYSVKHYSGIIYYILQQSHVMHQLVLLNLVVIHVIIVVTHETMDGQPGRQYIITFGLAYGSGQPFSLAHSTT